MNEPTITFKHGRVWFNMACLKELADTDYIRFVINSDKQKLLIEHSNGEESNEGRWCSWNSKKRKPKAIPCIEFFRKIINLMNWNDEYRYKIIGEFIYKGERISIMFDLNSVLIFKPNKIITEEQNNEQQL
ncbi:MAG: hypothetical protein FWF94_04750 [Oscillospiraceae bacterium]|nr:hypothetical protein [Oscillospiraceae bacterium]